MDRVTPLDLERVRIPRALRGYKTSAVDALLAQASAEIERLLVELKELRTEHGHAGKELDRFRSQEKLMTEALLLAQKTADETRAAAHKEAELILEHARQQAADYKRGIDKETDRLHWDAERLRADQEAFEGRFRALLHEFQQRLDQRAAETQLTLEERNAG